MGYFLGRQTPNWYVSKVDGSVGMFKLQLGIPLQKRCVSFCVPLFVEKPPGAIAQVK